jgi:hypothetical protein
LFDGNYAGTNSFLGNIALEGSMIMGGSFVIYDFGSGVTKDIVEIAYSTPTTYAGGFSSSTYIPNGFSLYYSDDGINWTLKWSLGANDMPTWAVNNTYAFTANEWDGTNSRGVNMRNPTIKQVRDDYPTNVLTGYVGGNSAAAGTARRIHRNRGWMPYRWLGINAGEAHIAGSTTSLGSPIPRSVYLIEQASGRVLDRADTFYPDCTYQFDGLNTARTYTVLGVDRTTIQNDVVYAHVTPVE